MTAGKIRQPLRALLLPSRHGKDGVSAIAFKNSLKALGVGSDDFSGWISLRINEWRENEKPSPDLKEIVRSVIYASLDGIESRIFSYGKKLGDSYFDIHEKLVEEHLMSHEEAVTFLSHSFLIIHLAFEEKISAAQIASLLVQRDQRASFSRQSIASFLDALGLEPKLSLDQVKSLYLKDSTQELKMFADADIFTAAEIVASAAEKLGYQGDLLESLKILASSSDLDFSNAPYTPYLQILHYQCSIVEYFDHAVKDLYEFSPRGVACNWLHKNYPDSIAGAANPFLNNAKSVEVVDIGWVRSKKRKERPGALALLSILQGLQAMGFSSKRELAWWIRLWLHRIIKFSAASAIIVPDSLDINQINTLLSNIEDKNTETFGVLEQRAVDSIAFFLHENWRSRGLGDSVNATNISRAKLGDCEFLNAESKQLIAYESHGGRLTPVYIEEHIATLKKSIERRIEELVSISDISNWTAKINFIAHTISGDMPVKVNLYGLSIFINVMTFKDFFSKRKEVEVGLLKDSININLIGPLKKQRTPNKVREKLLELINY